MSFEIQTPMLEQDPTLREIVTRIVDAYHPLRIFLFGSKARGTAQPESDYDLLVVVRDDAPIECRGSKLGHQRLWGVRKPADIVVCTDSWFRSRVGVVTSLPATVVREGKLLYAV